MSERQGFLLRLESDDGVVGWGEASPATWVGGEPLEQAAKALGQVVEEIRRLPAVAAIEELDLGCPSARCALETALLDLRGRITGRTVTELLGGKPGWLEASALLPDGPPDTMRAAAVELVGRGFRHLKLKVGGPVASDIDRLRAVRDGSRGAAILRLDANRGWSEDQASEALLAMAGPDLELVEEPVSSPTPEKLRDLRRRCRVPIALDESVADEAALEPFLGVDGASFLVLKLARTGGPAAALRLAARAVAGGFTVIVTDSIETSVGRAIVAHVARALPGPSRPIGLGGAFLVDAGPPDPRLLVAGPGLGPGASGGIGDFDA